MVTSPEVLTYYGRGDVLTADLPLGPAATESGAELPPQPAPPRKKPVAAAP
ncbi:hypothetical protein ACFVFI_36920 [Streptomyces sp. NPDC057705]|uniref:hypothetical protein n=1 Tax=Streptomyces sp. NPDC057705 TaxID=3346222 RepID=UPI0036B9A00D